MQGSIFKEINISTRIIILLILIVSTLVAKSLYLITFFTLFFVFLFILTGKSVKYYIDLLKNIKFWLLFVFITYIIICRNITDSLILIYKIILTIFFVKQFCFTVNFQSFASGVKTLLKPLKKFDLDKIAYNIIIFIYFIDCYISSKKEIFSKYSLNKKIVYIFSLKYNIIPRLFFTMSKLNCFESSLKIKFYNVNFEKKNNKSMFVLLCFVVLFIVVMCKEVII